MIELISLIAVILSTIGAILAWVAKIKWSNEFIKLKDEQIKNLDVQIKHLKEFSPMKIREYFLSVKEQLEAYNDYLKNKLQKAEIEIQEHNEANNQIDRYKKLDEILNSIDTKALSFINAAETFGNEFEIMVNAINHDKYPLPTLIIKPDSEEIKKYTDKTILDKIEKPRNSLDLGPLWAKGLIK